MGTDFDMTKIQDCYDWSISKITDNEDFVLNMLKKELLDEDNMLSNVKFALEKLVPSLPLGDLEDKVFKLVCTLGANFMSNTLKGVENLHNLDHLSQTQINRSEACMHLLSICVELLSNFIYCCEKLLEYDEIDPISVRSLLTSIEGIITNSFEHWLLCDELYKDSDESLQESLSAFLLKVRELHSKYIAMVTKQIKFNNLDDNDNGILWNTLSSLSVQGRQTLNLDVKIMADTLRAILAILERCRDDLEQKINLKELISCICEKITAHTKKIIYAERKNVEIDLKVSNFLLKFIIKVCGLLKEHVRHWILDLQPLLLLLYSFTPSWLKVKNIDQETIANIHKQLIIGADPLLGQIFTDVEFSNTVKITLNHSLIENPLGCIMFLLALMKKVSSSEHRDTYGDADLIDLMCCAVASCHSGLINGEYNAPGSSAFGQPNLETDLYQYALSGAASYVLTCSCSEFVSIEETLLKNILQPNPWKALFACDIWCLITRYGDANLCHSTLNVLIPTLTNIQIESSRPEFCYLSWLITRLLLFCESQYIEKLAENYSISSVRLWRYIGWSHYKSFDKNLVMHYLSKRTKTLTPEAFVEMECCLHGAGLWSQTASDQCKERFLSSDILPLWKINISDNSVHSRLICRYMAALINATAASMLQISSRDILKVLYQLTSIVSFSSSYLCILSLKIIKAMKTKDIPANDKQEEVFEAMGTLLRRFLESPNSLVKELGLEAFADFAHSTNHPEIIALSVAENTDLRNTVAGYLKKNLCALKGDSYKATTYEFIHLCSTYCETPVYCDVLTDCESIPPTSAPKRFKASEDLQKLPLIDDALAMFQTSIDVLSDNHTLLTNDQINSVRSVWEGFSNLGLV